MVTDRVVASLLDADIYERDIGLLDRGKWLNDSCLNFAFRCIEKTLPSRAILLLDPAVVSFFFIQCEDEEDILDFVAGNEIYLRDWLFVPITNRLSFAEASVHWSLLVIHIPSLRLMHFDSHASYNIRAAREVARKLLTTLNRSDKIEVREMDCAQQSNGSDCGLYSIMFAESIVQLIEKGEVDDEYNWDSFASETKRSLTPETAVACREKLKVDIATVAARHNS